MENLVSTISSFASMQNFLESFGKIFILLRNQLNLPHFLHHLEAFFSNLFCRQDVFDFYFYHTSFVSILVLAIGMAKVRLGLSNLALETLSYAHFYIHQYKCQIYNMRLQLNFFSTSKSRSSMPRCAVESSGLKIVSFIRTFKKTFFTKSHSVYFFVFTTIYTLITNVF